VPPVVESVPLYPRAESAAVEADLQQLVERSTQDTSINEFPQRQSPHLIGSGPCNPTIESSP